MKLKDLPVHLCMTHVLPYLDVSAMESMRETCRQMQTLCESDTLWEAICMLRWSGKANTPPQGQIFLGANLEEGALRSLSVAELRSACSFRGIDCRNFIEKVEFCAAITHHVKQWWRDHRGWKGKWRASYVCMEMYVKYAQHVSDEELCKVEWVLYFKDDPVHRNHIVRFSTSPRMLTMGNDDTYHGMTMPYRRYADGRVGCTGRPPLTQGRLPTCWTIHMQNVYCIYFQKFPFFDREGMAKMLASGEHSLYDICRED